VRPDAIYERSLELLARASRYRDASAPRMKVKSGLMAGLGESFEELVATLGDLRAAGTDVVTIGQYLQPHERRLPIEKYYSPEEFASLREKGEALGFYRVEAGPLVRSSYHARHSL
jgi:lipoic acid synthetase